VATGPPGAGPAAFAKPQPAETPASGDATQVFTGLRVPQIEASLVEIKPDGTAGRTVRLGKETIIGRLNCDISYPNDMLLSPRHSALGVREGKLYLRDLNSQNGAYIKQRQDAELSPGDVFLIGREIFRIKAANPRESPEGRDRQAPAGAPEFDRPVAAKLERILLSGEVVEEYNLDRPQITLGRTTGDLIFRNDPYMSGTHARILVEPRSLVLQDLKSRNGVYRRIRNEVELKDGDEFFLGEQIFRVRIESLEN
jgi:pSer/pThr/pTyr-binding forkhead associated (FHA) protein